MPRRRIELQDEIGELKLHFPYDAGLIEAVRGLPRRRFDPAEKAWYVPAEFAADVIEVLDAWDFDVPAEVRALAERGGRNARVRKMRRVARRRDSLTPSQLNTQVRRALREAFPRDMWVVGELSGFRPSKGRATFFELIERDPWGGNSPRAKVRAVAFEEDLGRIYAALRKMNPPIGLEDGLQVRLQVSVEVFEKHGTYQVRAREIDPYHTIVALAQRREKVLEALDELGISENNLDRPIPVVPLRIGLITSDGSDAMNDIVSELARSGFGFEVMVFDARMQGDRSEDMILRAMRWFAKHKKRVDVVVIARGGGARSEIAQLDSFKVGRAVCLIPIPVMCGIGHQMDHTVLDDLARSYKTPTAVAQALVAMVQTFVDELSELQRAIVPEAARRLAARKEALEHLQVRVGREGAHRVSVKASEMARLGADLARESRARLRESRRDFDRVSQRIPAAAQWRLGEHHRRLDDAASRLDPDRTGRALSRRRRTLDDLERRLARAAHRTARQDATIDPLERRLRRTEARITHQRRELAQLEARLRRATHRLLARHRDTADNLAARQSALDPARVLERGYAVVTGADGAAVRDPGAVARGDALFIKVALGRLEAVRTDGDPDHG